MRHHAEILFAQPRSACMGSIAHNAPSRGAVGYVLEENFQVCLLKSFVTQRIPAQYLVLTQLLFFPLILIWNFANLYSIAFLVDTRSSSWDCSRFSEARYQVDRGIAGIVVFNSSCFPLVIALFFKTEPDFRFLVLNSHIFF